MQNHALLQSQISEGRTTSEIEDIVTMIRLHLYNRSLPCGAMAIRNYMADEYGIKPLPTQRTIARILSSYGLTNQRTGHYEE